MQHSIALPLVKARETSGLSQKDVSHLAGVSQTVLSKVESGQRTPSIQLAVTLAAIYNRRFDYLFADLFDEITANVAPQALIFSQCVGPVDPNTLRGVSIRDLRERLGGSTSDTGDAV